MRALLNNNGLKKELIVPCQDYDFDNLKIYDYLCDH